MCIRDSRKVSPTTGSGRGQLLDVVIGAGSTPYSSVSSNHPLSSPLEPWEYYVGVAERGIYGQVSAHVRLTQSTVQDNTLCCSEDVRVVLLENCFVEKSDTYQAKTLMLGLHRLSCSRGENLTYPPSKRRQPQPSRKQGSRAHVCAASWLSLIHI